MEKAPVKVAVVNHAPKQVCSYRVSTIAVLPIGGDGIYKSVLVKRQGRVYCGVEEALRIHQVHFSLLSVVQVDGPFYEGDNFIRSLASVYLPNVAAKAT